LIIDDSAYNIINKKYTEYGMYVNTSRHIVGLLGGLKPSYTKTVLTAMEFAKDDWNLTINIAAKTVDRYSPHGDCLRKNTIIQDTSGKQYNIIDLVKNNIPNLEVWCLTNDNDIVSGNAHSFRVGQTTRELIKLTINNNYELEVTENHPIQIIRDISKRPVVRHSCDFDCNFIWIMAKDLIKGDIINSVYLAGVISKHFKTKVHRLDRINCKEGEGNFIHHKNEDRHDNSSKNLIKLTESQHKAIHGKTLVKNTHISMHEDKNSVNAKRKRVRDKLICSTRNKHLRLSKFFSSVDNLIWKKIEVSEETVSANPMNYVRGMYLPPLYSKYATDFSGLMKLYKRSKEITSVKLFAELSGTSYEFGYNENIYPEELRRVRIPVTELINKPKHNNLPNFGQNVLKYWINGVKLILENDYIDNVDKINTNLNLSIITKVDKITLDEPEEFYDFTVDKYESMLIPTNKSNLFINVHNSSITPVVSRLVNAGIFKGKGNHGSRSITGEVDEPAAPRYTKAMMHPAYQKLFGDLIEMVPKYENEYNRMEPAYLPSPIPLSLTFGALGIGIGTGCSIPQFTPKSILDAYLNNNPELLRNSLGIEIEETEGLHNLWNYGRGFLRYKYKTYLSGIKAYIEGNALTIPSFKELQGYMDSGRVERTNLTTGIPKIAFNKTYGVKYPSLDEIYTKLMKASRFTKSYYIRVKTPDNIIRDIGLFDWIKINYENYKFLMKRNIEVTIAEKEFQILVYTNFRKVADIIVNKDTSYEDIAKNFNIPVEVVRAISNRSINTLRSMDPISRVGGLENDIKSLKALNLDDYIKNVIYSM